MQKGEDKPDVCCQNLVLLIQTHNLLQTRGQKNIDSGFKIGMIWSWELTRWRTWGEPNLLRLSPVAPSSCRAMPHNPPPVLHAPGAPLNFPLDLILVPCLGTGPTTACTSDSTKILFLFSVLPWGCILAPSPTIKISVVVQQRLNFSSFKLVLP